MALPLLSPLRDLFSAQADDSARRVALAVATLFLGAVAVSFLVASGIVALTAAAGFPVAALAFAALFAVLALALHLIGRAQSARRAARIAAVRSRATSDIVLATALARTAQPLLPLAAFLATFALGRRL
ncbi:hypothetical protein [Defluviimonas salinarum]|uniref:Uncharacterized protein n=1 Tax=Defluviimonas salinarum TaxID=2992147 RepID=A0ABT3JAB8_9RHOB|nr:hypothetical protein [Defluviimonas salinarum]MCW3784640.1 hypothetical protein [Defluviimonas salinarum]